MQGALAFRAIDANFRLSSTTAGNYDLFFGCPLKPPKIGIYSRQKRLNPCGDTNLEVLLCTLNTVQVLS